MACLFRGWSGAARERGSGHWLPGLLLLCWLLLAAAAPAGATTQDIRTATATVTSGGRVETGPVALPYHWDRHHRGATGTARFVMQFALAHQPTDPYGVLLPRVGNAYDVWLNGTLLTRRGDLVRGGGADYSKLPRYVVVSPRLLRTHNELVIDIRADSGRRGGLMPPRIGPDDELGPRFQRTLRLHLAGSLVVGVLSLLVGALGLTLWLTQSETGPDGRVRRDPIYLYVGLAELGWTLRLADRLVADPPLPWVAWSILQTLAMATWFCCMLMFCLSAAGWRERPAVRPLRTVLWLLFASGALAATLAIELHRPLLLTLWYGLALLLLLPFSVVFLAAAVRRGAGTAHRWVAAALVLNVAVGVRDWLLFRFSSGYDHETWLRYSAVLFALVLAYVVLTRFRAASRQARELSIHLAERVAQKEAELSRTYERMAQLAREQARASERTRILRDMHDGVGAHLSAAIRQLQSGAASRDELLLTLRESLDQLKLSIDALHLEPGDVTTLLANLRYRLEPRLQAAGIALEWDVALLPPLARLDDGAMRQLQYMVLEVLSNVLQHAQASRLRIEARVQGDGARLSLIDNGRGFDPAQSPRNGLRSLRERAQAIGASLDIHSEPGATRIEILL